MENTHTTPTSVGRMIRERREELGLSQDRLAELIGMSQEWVTKVETGRIAAPRIANLQRVASALEIDLTSLIIAANYAQRRPDAERVAEHFPVAPDDPVARVATLMRDRGLTPGQLDLIRQIVESLPSPRDGAPS